MRLTIVVAMGFASTAAAAPTGDALVWVDAPMYPDPSDQGLHVQFGELGGDRSTHLGDVVPMHIVGAEGDFVEVEPTADVQCAWSRIVRPDVLASLHLFVKRTDLAPVIAKRFAATYKDGSRVALEPGLAISGDANARIVPFDADRVPVDVPDASIGWSYTPHPIAAVPPAAAKGDLLETAAVQLGAHVFQLAGRMVRKTEARGDHVLIPIAARCATAVVSAPKAAVTSDVAVGYGSGIGALGGVMRQKIGDADRFYLPKGTKLTSATGTHVVAILAGALDLPAEPTDKLACADFEIRRDASESNVAATPRDRRLLHLCAPATAVVIERRRRGF